MTDVNESSPVDASAPPVDSAPAAEPVAQVETSAADAAPAPAAETAVEAAPVTETTPVAAAEPIPGLDPEAALAAIEVERKAAEQAWLQAWHDKVIRAREKLKRKEIRLEEIEEERKEQKKLVDMDTAALMEIIDERDQPSLFPAAIVNSKPAGEVQHVQDDTATIVPLAPAPPANRPWREIPVTELGFSKPSIPTLLADHGLKTLGDIISYKNRGKDFSEIKGLGPTKLVIIEDTILQFESQHPELGKLCDIPEPGTAGEFPRLANGEPTEIVDLSSGESASAPAGETAPEPVASEEAASAAPVDTGSAPAETGVVETSAGGDVVPTERSENFAVSEVAQFSLKAGEICSKASMGLLVNPSYTDDGNIPEITETIGERDSGYLYVVTQSLKLEDDVYALRPLVAPTSTGKVAGDPFCNVRVRFDGMIYAIGSCDNTHLVRDR